MLTPWQKEIADNTLNSLQNAIHKQQNTESKQNKTQNSLMAKNSSRCNAEDVVLYNCNTSGRCYMLINIGSIIQKTSFILRLFTQCSSCFQSAFLFLMHVNEFVAVLFSVMSTEQFLYGLRLEKCLPCCISMSIECLFFKAVLMQDFVFTN